MDKLSEYFKIGQRIQEFRNDRGLLQKELAEKAGIGLRTIQKYENNEVNPKTDSLEKIANALGYSLEGLLDLEGLPERLKKDVRRSETEKLKSKVKATLTSLDQFKRDLSKLMDSSDALKQNLIALTRLEDTND